MENTSVWTILEPLLRSQPEARHIALHPAGLFNFIGSESGRYPKEMIVIRGTDEIFSPPDPLELFDLQTLAAHTISPIGHDSPSDFAGYVQGITNSINGMRTIAILLHWVDQHKRSMFVDPGQPAGGTWYERTIASPMHKLEQQGATMESYLCDFKLWTPVVAQPTKHRRSCSVM